MFKKVIEHSIILMLLFVGCSKNSVNERHKTKNTQVRISEVKAYPGNKRIKFTWKIASSDKSPAETIIFWNHNRDSLQVPINSETSTFIEDSIIINNLPERKYNFVFVGVAHDGSTSTRILKKARIYGPKYQASLTGRKINDISYNYDKKFAEIHWAAPKSEGIITKLNYTNRAGRTKSVRVSPEADSTVLNNLLLVGKNVVNSEFFPEIAKHIKFSYQSTFLPEPTAIDTFAASIDSVDKKTVRLKLKGPVTTQELNVFKKLVLNYNPDAGENYNNVWVFGSPGKVVEAAGLMYEATKGIDILNRMIFYCDRILASRDDLASAKEGGQLKLWTGKVEPVWPSHVGKPAGAGIEQGRIISHLAFCAKLILQNSAIWSNTVPIGDPHNFGATYKERALTYIRQSDYVIDHWILPHFIRRSDHNRYYFPGPPNTYKPNQPAPWNQAFMLTDALVRLTECHMILNDAPNRIAKYDALVKPNLKWFLSTMRKSTLTNGDQVYVWDYALNQQIEDTNHFAYEGEGLWIAYNSGRYKDIIPFKTLVPFANTYMDVVLGTKTNGHFAGRVDGSSGSGHSGGDDYVRWEYFYLAGFRPDGFRKMVKIEMKQGKIKHSPVIMAIILWQKQRLFSTEKN